MRLVLGVRKARLPNRVRFLNILGGRLSEFGIYEEMIDENGLHWTLKNFPTYHIGGLSIEAEMDFAHRIIDLTLVNQTHISLYMKYIYSNRFK